MKASPALPLSQLPAAAPATPQITLGLGRGRRALSEECQRRTTYRSRSVNRGRSPPPEDLKEAPPVVDLVADGGVNAAELAEEQALLDYATHFSDRGM